MNSGLAKIFKGSEIFKEAAFFNSDSFFFGKVRQ